jgi:hypothetical protein
VKTGILVCVSRHCVWKQVMMMSTHRVQRRRRRGKGKEKVGISIYVRYTNIYRESVCIVVCCQTSQLHSLSLSLSLQRERSFSFFMLSVCLVVTTGLIWFRVSSGIKWFKFPPDCSCEDRTVVISIKFSVNHR